MVLIEIVKASRPHQWIKNLLLYAGFLFTLGRSPVGPAFARATLGLVLFCLLSASAYLVNDARDVEKDRLHPRKKHRPIASGKLPAGTALAAAILFAVAGIAGSFAADIGFGVVALLYLAVTLSYSFALKHIVLLDVMALAAGYVLRAVAGAAIVGVPTSFWLALCTLLLSLFLALCKRRSEMTSLAEGAVATRAILGEYTVPLLDQMISVVTSSALLAYALYTYFTPTSPALVSNPLHADHWTFRQHLFTFTIPFVVYGIYRYLYLVYRRDLGGSPEAIFLEDRPLQVNTLLWVLCCVAALVLARAFPW